MVAFPQHGLFYTDTLPLLKDVAQMDAVNFIGGVDPYTLDSSIEKAMGTIVQLAVDNNKGVDVLVFVDASCSAEAVSRISPVKSLIHKGTVVF